MMKIIIKLINIELITFYKTKASLLAAAKLFYKSAMLVSWSHVSAHLKMNVGHILSTNKRKFWPIKTII